MEEDERKAYELFTAKQGLINQEPSFTAAFSAPAEQLSEGRRRARALFAQGPSLTFSAEQRAELGGERFPELQGTAALFSRALARHPELHGDTSARPALIDCAVRLDQAFGRMVWVGHLFWRGGESGQLLTAAAARALCQGVLNQADARDRSGALTPAQRNAVKTAFAEPRRLAEEARGLRLRQRETTEKSEGPIRAEISQAQESAAMARVIEAFLAGIRRTP